VPYPPKSTTLNNFDCWYAENGSCTGALLAFRAYGDKPVFARCFRPAVRPGVKLQPPFQRIRSISTTARALFFSRALSTKPTPPPMWQSLLPLALAAYCSKEECEFSGTLVGPFAPPPLPLCRIPLMLLPAILLGLGHAPQFAGLGLWPLGAPSVIDSTSPYSAIPSDVLSGIIHPPSRRRLMPRAFRQRSHP